MIPVKALVGLDAGNQPREFSVSNIDDCVLSLRERCGCPLLALIYRGDLIAAYRYGDDNDKSFAQHHAGSDGDDVHMRLGLLILLADCGLAASKLPYEDCW